MNKIKQLREERQMSQERLAYTSGVAVKTIQRLEQTGRANSETLRSVAAALGVGLDDLFEPVAS
jgi:transcriptional regulator with XRE-family HTH domain